MEMHLIAPRAELRRRTAFELGDDKGREVASGLLFAAQDTAEIVGSEGVADAVRGNVTF